MKIYVYLDESGSIHKNSRTRYFAVGGYFTFLEEKVKIISKYKKLNQKIKLAKNVSLNKEIKSYDMSQLEKINIFTKIQNIKSFNGCIKIFDKKRMKKEIVCSNIFFNYAVKLLIEDCIIPSLKIKKNLNYVFYLNIDNRNVGVGNLKNLEKYLQTEFCMNNFSFSVKYFDSRNSYGIQLADLVVNTFYNYYKDKSIIDNLLPFIEFNKFNISMFPKIHLIDIIKMR